MLRRPLESAGRVREGVRVTARDGKDQCEDPKNASDKRSQPSDANLEMNGRQPDAARGNQSHKPQGRRADSWSLATRVSGCGHSKTSHPKGEPQHGTGCTSRSVREHRALGREEFRDVGGPRNRNDDQGYERTLLTQARIKLCVCQGGPCLANPPRRPESRPIPTA